MMMETKNVLPTDGFGIGDVVAGIYAGRPKRVVLPLRGVKLLYKWNASNFFQDFRLLEISRNCVLSQTER